MANSNGKTATIIDFPAAKSARRTSSSPIVRSEVCRGIVPVSGSKCDAGKSRDSLVDLLASPSVWWEMSIKQKTEATASRLAGADCLEEFVVVGLRAGLSELGVTDVKIPDNASSWMQRGLSYRVPNEAWGCEGARRFPSYGLLLERYLVERREFIGSLGVETVADLADYIAAYGRASALLNKKASKVLRKRRSAYRVACKVCALGPSIQLSLW